MSSSRARKILGLIAEESNHNTINESPNYYSNRTDENREKLQKENVSVKMYTEEIHENDEAIQKIDRPVVWQAYHAASVDPWSSLNKENDTTESQFVNTQSNKSLVPYDESDISMSDNEENCTQLITTKTADRRSSSSSSSSSSSKSSSSSSSSTSSSSSSSSESNISQTIQDTNILSQPISKTNVIIDETDDDMIENSPRYQMDREKNLSIRITRKAKRYQNYKISPIYSDESDVDLSDGDRTYFTIKPAVKKNYFFDQSCSTTSSEISKSSPPKKGRKRTRNPSKWKQNIIKSRRNKGKSYVSVSKTQKIIPARCLKVPCSEKCRLKCTEKINTDSRYNLFRQFWDLRNLVQQRAYISSCMLDIEPKYKYTNAKNPRRNNKAYYFAVDNTKVRVCKAFFKSTLDISDRMIFTIQNKVAEQGFALEDLRGKHQGHKKIDPQLRIAIKEHINSIPRIESHYLRASSSREFIDGSKTIKDLYEDFKLHQEQNNKEGGTYITYYKIFTTEFNLGFFQPKKDQCDLCNAYHNSNNNQKKDLEEKYKTHTEEKNYSRIEKVNDRKRVNTNVKVAVYDLEAVLQCPKGDTSSFYYKSKLNCYNLTLTELTKLESKVAYKNVHCYFWSESDAKRGAIEIGSCVWEYLKALCEEDENEKEVIFYSDNCCGQNKNKYIASLYLFAVQTLNIKSITHKFLIRGHTQNEADSVHSLIEREVKKNLKSGPIYTPDQYVAIIKSAKKIKPPLTVHELNFESFYDIKTLQEEWGYNFTTDTVGNIVNWNEIKLLKMTKDNTTSFFYKTSYKEENYKEVDVRNKRKKMKPFTEITLKAAYTGKQELSTNKKKDLKELISKALIPSFYVGFIIL